MARLQPLCLVFLLLFLCPFISAQVNPGAAAKAASLGLSNCLFKKYPDTQILPEVVIGQVDFSSSTKQFMETPQSFAISPATGKLFVSAFGGTHRIHRFSKTVALLGGAAPEHSFSNGTACNQTTLLQPRITIDKKDSLWVADMPKNRVLQFPKASSLSSDLPVPNKVFGQEDFVTCLPGTDMNHMNGPSSVLIDDERKIMWVTESANHRVTRFDKIFTRRKTNSYANISIGLAGEIGCNIDTLTYPLGMALDHKGALWIGDRLNQRVVRYSNAHLLETGASADLILGKDTGDYCKYEVGSQTRLGFPQSITFDEEGTMYIADSGNNRVAAYFKAADLTQNGLPIDFQIGQIDFVATKQSPPATQSTFNKPTWVFYDSKFSQSLYVLSTAENRVLKFCSNKNDSTPIVIKGAEEKACESENDEGLCTAPEFNELSAAVDEAQYALA